ncbi:MAG: ATP-binding protein [Rubrivivax sp.]
MKPSIAARIELTVLALHALLLPALYLGIDYVVTRSHAEVFVQQVRTYARNLAEELEVGGTLDSAQRTRDFLDLAVAHGDADFAGLVIDGQSLQSRLGDPKRRWPDRNDLDFGAGGDGMQCLALPVARGSGSAELRLCFDEAPTRAQIAHTMQQTLVALAIYLLCASTLALMFGRRLARPIVALAQAARRIASGDYALTLQSPSGVRELHELGRDLENMRGELVGVNERLRSEMAERERTEQQRRELEAQLRHRHRIETVGTLAGGLAHEINNALQPIVLLTESALADAPPGSALREDLEAVLASARRAREIVVKVLTFSRTAGEVRLEPIDLEPVVREAVRLFGVMAASAQAVRLELAGPYPRVRADRALAVQMIVNLCTNGWQAMRDAPGTLTVSLRRVQVAGARAVSDGDYLVLEVADTGHGMSSETLERIFEPFFTTREVGSGSGLGLAVVHGIAESFGAAIVVHSEPGKGSRFRIHLPVVAEAGAVPADAP